VEHMVVDAFLAADPVLKLAEKTEDSREFARLDDTLLRARALLAWHCSVACHPPACCFPRQRTSVCWTATHVQSCSPKTDVGQCAAAACFGHAQHQRF
jgi:hypothetical protein